MLEKTPSLEEKIIFVIVANSNDTNIWDIETSAVLPWIYKILTLCITSPWLATFEMVVCGVLCWETHENKVIVNGNGDKCFNGNVLVNPLSQLLSLIQIQIDLTRYAYECMILGFEFFILFIDSCYKNFFSILKSMDFNPKGCIKNLNPSEIHCTVV